MLYHGVRSCDCPIENDHYYGSSKYTPNEVPNKTILTEHSTREDAMTEEVRYHEEFDVKNNTQYYNRANQTATGFDGMSGVGRKLSKEHIEIIRKRHTNKFVSSETKKLMSKSQKGRTVSNKHREKLRQANLGKTHSKETKEKLRKLSTGFKHTSESKQKISKARMGNTHALGYKHRIVTCPHCNKTGGETGMKRWHFENCKFNITAVD